MQHLPKYLARLNNLKEDARTVGGVRLEFPYKPALLLAVLEGVEEGLIQNNRIEITLELIAAFEAYCQLLSSGPEYAACPISVAIHLQSSGFWHLQAKPGRN